MSKRSRGRSRLVSGALAVALPALLGLGACADDGGDDAEGGGTEEVTRHLESLEAAYAAGGTSEVDSHLRALDDAWADAESDVDGADQVQELLDTLEAQVGEDAPPEAVSTTVEQINQALGS